MYAALAILNLTIGLALTFGGSSLGLLHIAAGMIFSALYMLEGIRADDELIARSDKTIAAHRVGQALAARNRK